jgi:chromosomal replication initiation ATPase DnaA
MGAREEPAMRIYTRAFAARARKNNHARNLAAEAAAKARTAPPRPRRDARAAPPGALADRIVGRICRAFGISRSALSGKRRDQRTALARHAAAYWMARRTPLSLGEIGKELGRDRTTVGHSKTAYVAKRAAQGRTLRKLPAGGQQR